MLSKVLIGSWINSGSPIISEMMAECGYDFLCVDAEHSAVDLPETQTMFQAIKSGNPECMPFVRLHGVDYALVKRYIDAGAKGIICPLVTTREEAELLVDAVYYPPLGKRGVGFCRANEYGLKVEEHFQNANQELLVSVQIEHIEAVQNLEDILSVEGIDAVFIGPYDLSASMGIAAQFDHPDYIEARNKILKTCKDKGVIAGIHVVQPDPKEVLLRLQEGYQLIALSLDITIIQQRSLEALSKIRADLRNSK